jgi:hypothetical protein
LRRRGGQLWPAALLLLWAGPAFAQEAVSPEAFHGLAEVRLGAADGEPSWVDGGFGKAALGGSSGRDWKTRLDLSQAVVEWRPHLGFAVSAVVSGQWQPALDHPLDLDEAYLKFRAPPTAAGRLSARAGLFYPPVSMEHDGPGWTTTDLLSASAINTWIGEEVKVGGVEATFQRDVGASQVEATGAVFGWNDTSGTLLAFRGWDLGGLRTGLNTTFPLPPLSSFMTRRQADETTPVSEIDHRAGYYGRLEWRPPAPVSFNALYYDNRGDLVGERDLQWAWRTRFANLGVRWEPDDRTHVLAQAMSGRTEMGYATPTIWADATFRAAYVLASRQAGAERFTGRLDWFDVHDRAYSELDNDNGSSNGKENGWAATLGWRHEINAHMALMLEAQHVASGRPSRALSDLAKTQNQTVLQSALRLSF